MSVDREWPFLLTVGLAGDEATVSVAGEVDLVTAPLLSAMLFSVANEGYPTLVLDLSGVTFLDGSGLRVIAGVAGHLAADHDLLTVRSAPTMTRRILELTGVGALVHVEAVAPPSDLGTEHLAEDLTLLGSDPPTTDVMDLARWGSLPRTHPAIDAALELITALADATVEGADGVSVSLERHGDLMTVASTNETVRRMDDHQYATGQGPCLAAAADGHRFHVDSLEDERRWPDFVPRAMAEGIGSILSTPLMTADRPVGALNIYSSTAHAFGPTEQERAAVLASQASAILAGSAAEGTADWKGDPLTQALGARAVIARAQGVLMASQEISATDADALLHRVARASGVPVLQKAAEIVGSTRPPSSLDDADNDDGEAS